MPLARFRGVHIAESALLDQSATAVADLLERKTAVLGDEEAFTLLRNSSASGANSAADM